MAIFRGTLWVKRVNVLQMAARHVQKDTLLVLDPSDLSEKYAEKMEYICQAHDGSEGKVADGYPMIHVIGCELGSKQILRRSYKVLFKMVRSYLRRWGIEETIRFIKTSYDLEDGRALRYRGLQNLMPLVLAVIYFSAMVLDGKEKLKILAGHVLSVAKQVFGIPDFKYYALSDGLKKLFDRHPGRPHRLRRGPPDPRLLVVET